MSLKVAVLSPLPARSERPPESGVAEYTAALVRSLDFPVALLAQEGALPTGIGKATIAGFWKPNLALPLLVRRALKRVRPEILHVQHEFNLYGGLLQGFFLTSFLIGLRRSGLRILTTVHGIVARSDVTLSFLERNSLPRSAKLVRWAFALSYWGIGNSSDLLIVHHRHFRDILVRDYNIPDHKIRVIPHGSRDYQSNPVRSPSKRGQTILCIGFLAGYKLPELLVDVAESGALPDATFVFCVGLNPRVTGRPYLARAAELERRIRRLEPAAVWKGYIPDEELPATFASADVVVLPYTECVSVSGISALAQQWRVPICYSRPLRPLFGPGPFEFSLDSPSLTEAILKALTVPVEVPPQFISWSQAADETVAAWQVVASPA